MFWRRFRIVPAVVFLALIAASATLPLDRGAAQVEISGEWDVTIRGGVAARCHVSFSPSGTGLAAILSCPGYGVGEFEGTQDGRAFALSGSLPVLGLPVNIEFAGELSDDGTTISGKWTALGALTGTFTGTRARAAPVANLTGDWRVEFVGDTVDSCSAVVEQSDSDVSLMLECEGSGPATLAGAVVPLGLRLEGPSLEAPRRITASVSEDGGAFAGNWQDPATGGSGRVLAVRVGLPIGPLELTGDWRAQLGGAFPIVCQVAIRQTGVDLVSAFDCEIIGEITASGEVDPSTGTFHLSNGRADVLAVTSGGGSLATGAWALDALDLAGTLSATKTSDEPSLIDLTGLWNLVLRGDIVSTCEANVIHVSRNLAADVDCRRLGSGTLAGSATLLSGRFRLRGPVGERDIALEGRVAEDALSVTGEWYLPEERESFSFEDPGEFGCFALTPIDAELAACEPPAYHPSVIVEQPGLTVTQAQIAEIREELAIDRRSTFSYAGLAGLVVAVVALAAWRLRFQP